MSTSEVEHYLTIPEAAERLGIPVWSLRRAIARGVVPSTRFGSSRRYVRLSEIENAAKSEGYEQVADKGTGTPNFGGVRS
ncbi:MAG: helix-turn-helix domain-containing protein [Bauldia sp.]|nr:helix-turn-helix domain-containing protein [Bauldia sp.]